MTIEPTSVIVACDAGGNLPIHDHILPGWTTATPGLVVADTSSIAALPDHTLDNSDGRHWSLTHARSGTRLSGFRDPESAQEAAWYMGRLPVDWTMSGSEIRQLPALVKEQIVDTLVSLKGSYGRRNTAPVPQEVLDR